MEHVNNLAFFELSIFRFLLFSFLMEKDFQSLSQDYLERILSDKVTKYKIF